MFPTTTVTNTETPVTPAAAATPAAQTEDLGVIKAEIASLQGRLADSERANEYWRGQASAQRETPAPAAPAKEPEDDTDVLDVLTTKGAKGLDEILAKRGYIRREDAEAVMDSKVNAKAAQLTAEQDLLKTYPDLSKRDSEFFRSTAVHFGELKQQGVPEPIAMRIAAERAELDNIRSGKTKTPAAIDQQKEADRLARIKAQSGDRSTRGAETTQDEADELTAHEKHICRAMGITEEAYVARVKAGTNVSANSAGAFNRQGKKAV